MENNNHDTERVEDGEMDQFLIVPTQARSYQILRQVCRGGERTVRPMISIPQLGTRPFPADMVTGAPSPSLVSTIAASVKHLTKISSVWDIAGALVNFDREPGGHTWIFDELHLDDAPTNSLVPPPQRKPVLMRFEVTKASYSQRGYSIKIVQAEYLPNEERWGITREAVVV